MTLFRQIALIVAITFLLLIAAVLWNSFRQSSEFLQGQLQVTAQDMATTLGITVANAAPDQDLAVIETFVNATFDSGYYSKIELLSTDGSLLFSKQRDVSLQDVPDWFISWVPLQSVVGSTQIMRGWFPYGTLNITLHPGYVYTGLFENLKTVLFWSDIVAIAGIAVLWLLLHIVLRPLRKVREQAEAIQENRFIRQETIPRTRELSHVVTAMNRMVDKVQEVFHEQTQTLQRYQDLKYRDEQTGLNNRVYFINQLGTIWRDESRSGGVVVAVHLHGMEQIQEQKGYKMIEKLLLQIAKSMRDRFDADADTFCARLDKEEFAFYLPGTMEMADDAIQQIYSDFKQLVAMEQADDMVWLFAGAARVEESAQLGDLLSSLDFSLTQAESMGPYSFYTQQQTNSLLPKGKIQWRKWLQQSIDDRRFFLVGQAVQNRDETLYHNEVFVRLRDESSNMVSAGVFMPIASSLGLEFEIDKAVFEMAKNLSRDGKSVPIALNLSSSFLNRADALAELLRFMRRCVELKQQLYVEISHTALLHHVEMVDTIANQLRDVGFSLGIDNLDLNNSLQPLQIVRPTYVKMNARQLVEMAEEGVSAGLQALLTLTRGMDIRLIAVGVDSEEMKNKLLQLGVNGMQGNYFGEMREIS